MKILIATDCYTPMINGVVTSVINLETQLRRMGHEVKILCPAQNLHGEDDGTVVRIGSVGTGRHCNGTRVAWCFRKENLQKLINWKPDIIHTQSEFFIFAMAKKIASAVGCPIVHTYHTIYENYTHYFSPSVALGRKAVVAMTRHVLHNTEAVIAPTPKVESLLLSYGITKPIYVIPTGLDLQRFEKRFPAEQIAELKNSLGIQLNKKVLLTVGRVAKEKNLDELIRYFARISNPDIILCIVGGGTYLDELKHLARETGTADRIIFTDAVQPENIPLYYQTGDVFLSASQSETQGLTYLEAMASGLPLVCRNDPCLSGVVTNGINGGLYNSYEEFEKWINFVLDEQSHSDKLSLNAVQAANQFSSAAFAEKVLNMYKQVLKKQQLRIA